MSDSSITIIGEITSGTLTRLCDILSDIPKGDEIQLSIASYGGEILSAFAMIDALKGYKTTATVLGFACSAAAILALSCDTVIMSEHASLMIHSAWADNIDEDDPGIQRCNEVQLDIIKKRCPSYTSEMLITDRWLSAQECVDLGLADSINNDSVYNLAAEELSAKYAAKIKSNLFANRRVKTMAEENMISTDEIIEEIKEEKEADGMSAEEPAEEPEKHDVIDVIEKLVERLDDIESRLKALEKPSDNIQEVEAECEPSTDDRINSLYNSVCARPSASVTVACNPTKKPVCKVLKGFESYTNI